MRSRSAACLLLIAFATPVFADAVKWDVSRTTAPDSVEELKALQATVKNMVEKTTPATVAIRYEVGAGSGVIVSDDGLVLTAAHVVSRRGNTGKQSNRAILQLADGSTIRALVLGRNSRMDSAMLKITDKVPKNAKWPGASEGKWPHVELGKSADLKKGQWVVALGHPGGPKKDRRAPVRLGQMVKVTETGSRIASDCTLVGGDSGGPLFDLNGKLLGIHSSIGNDLTQNFHVPINNYEKEWERLRRGDTIGARADGWIGLTLAGNDDRDKNSKELPRSEAKPLIEAVTKGSPAESAGLKAGDLILEFKGEKVNTSEDIDQMLGGSKPGDILLVKVRRGDDLYEFEVTLDKRK